MNVEGPKKTKFSGTSSLYWIYLGKEWIVLDPEDSAVSECMFINHSCKPNTEFEKFARNGEEMIRVRTLKDIEAGEEITIHYGSYR